MITEIDEYSGLLTYNKMLIILTQKLLFFIRVYVTSIESITLNANN